MLVTCEKDTSGMQGLNLELLSTKYDGVSIMLYNSVYLRGRRNVFKVLCHRIPESTCTVALGVTLLQLPKSLQ